MEPIPATAYPVSGTGPGDWEPASTDDSRAPAVTALYREHALGLIRLGYVMLGDRAAAEDVVQEAFCALYQRWRNLASADKAVPYLRVSVLNGCRSVLRRSTRNQRVIHLPPAGSADSVPSAEAAALTSEERRELVNALRRLPDRQREALVLRFYLDLTDAEIARDMGISEGTVRSTTHRALVALGVRLKET